MDLPLVEPGLEASDAPLRARCTSWKVEPKQISSETELGVYDIGREEDAVGRICSPGQDRDE